MAERRGRPPPARNKQGGGKPPPYWARACAELSRRDPVMARLIREYGGCHLRGGGDPFATLCRAIVGQQISLKAADSIWGRLLAHFGAVAPRRLHRCRFDTLYRCGLSRQKSAYLKNVARFFVHERVTRRYFRTRDFDQVRDALLAIPGIGAWTFEMFAIFYLQHPDVLPLGDLGLVQAIERQYARRRPLGKARRAVITANWRPWRTVATWYLWRSIDPEPVIYPGP